MLVYADATNAPLHRQARRALRRLRARGQELYISRQVLREFMAVLSRPQSFSAPLPAAELAATVRMLQRKYQVLEDSQFVTAELPRLLTTIPMGGKQVHDANIVATMLVHRVPRLLTHNTGDFNRFPRLITVVPLV